MKKVHLKILDRQFSIYRFSPTTEVPPRIFNEPYFWIGKTDEELSIVCDAKLRLRGGQCNPGWTCFKILGPLDLSEIGILSELSTILASSKISIFALSTFDTDYILVKTENLAKATRTLMDNGYQVLERI